MDYEIKIKATKSALGAICAGIKVAKALGFEMIDVEFREGFSLQVSNESKANDIYNIWRLTIENQKLKEAK